jgi:hypothetical protein
VAVVVIAVVIAIGWLFAWRRGDVGSYGEATNAYLRAAMKGDANAASAHVCRSTALVLRAPDGAARLRSAVGSVGGFTEFDVLRGEANRAFVEYKIHGRWQTYAIPVTQDAGTRFLCPTPTALLGRRE